MTKTKNIKVQYSSRCTYGGYYGSSRYTSYPKIQMEGKWLEALGFHIGDHLQVEYEEGYIKISLAPKPEPVMMVAEPVTDYGRTRRKDHKKDTV
ncbi:MAG: SymE family type I addiction module toxin [Oribacterium sp.]|nr:SymE family type I addiction module toxin [Oribacterium sp.]